MWRHNAKLNPGVPGIQNQQTCHRLDGSKGLKQGSKPGSISTSRSPCHQKFSIFVDLPIGFQISPIPDNKDKDHDIHRETEK